MKFMLLLQAPAATEGQAPSTELVAAMDAFNASLKDAGVFVDAAGFAPTAQGFRTINDGADVVVEDGPFTGRDQVVFGFWTISAASRAEAVTWAEKVPFEEAGTGTVEVRQIFGAEDFPEGTPDGGELEMPKQREGTQRWFMGGNATADSEAGVMPEPGMFEAMDEYIGGLVKNGNFLDGEGLHPTSNASRVRYEKGTRTVTDGPFAETKELIAGFSIVQVDSIEEAKEIARRGQAIGGFSTGESRLMM